MTPSSRSTEHLIKRNIDEDLGLNTTENPLWVDQYVFLAFFEFEIMLILIETLTQGDIIE